MPKDFDGLLPKQKKHEQIEYLCTKVWRIKPWQSNCNCLAHQIFYRQTFYHVEFEMQLGETTESHTYLNKTTTSVDYRITMAIFIMKLILLLSPPLSAYAPPSAHPLPHYAGKNYCAPSKIHSLKSIEKQTLRCTTYIKFNRSLLPNKIWLKY